ncbi:MAG: tetratricopeptide repeat protein [Chthonomonadales bacterium]
MKLRWVVACIMAATYFFYHISIASAQPKAVPQNGNAGSSPGVALPACFDNPVLSEAKRMLISGEFANTLREIQRLAKTGISLKLILPAQAEVFRQTDYLDRELQQLYNWSLADPKNEEPQLRLFYRYFDLGWTAEAAKVSERAYQIAPRSTGPLTAKAIYFYRSDEPQRGLPFVDSALKLHPNSESLINLKASILIKAHQSANAIPFLQQNIARNPRSLPNQEALANAYLQSGKPTEAGSIFRQLQLQNPAHIEAAYQLGLLAQKKGDYKEAIHQFEKTVRLDIKHNNVAFLLGQLYLTHGKAEDGRKLLAIFKKLDANTRTYNQTIVQLRTRPKDAALHYKMAQFHLGSAEYSKAIVELRRVLELQPIHPSARQELAKALNEHGRATEAREVMDAARPQRPGTHR